MHNNNIGFNISFARILHGKKAAKSQVWAGRSAPSGSQLLYADDVYPSELAGNTHT